MKSRMGVRTKLLCSLLVCFTLASTLGGRVAQAAPKDPMAGASPTYTRSAPEPVKLNQGDWGVAEQRGAATYTFPIVVPPGRNRMEPALALRYSSQSPLRGGIAVGWTLDLPSIRTDYAEWSAADAAWQPVLSVSAGGASGRVVPVDDKPVEGKTVYGGQAYRAEFDQSFTRLEQVKTAGHGFTGWVAFTPDGTRHFFEEQETLMNGVTFIASDARTRWLITREEDSFGNTIRYFWSPVRELGAAADAAPVDYIIKRIEYGSNTAANLKAHAKIEFEYADVEVCRDAAGNPLSIVPVGAAYKWTGGVKYYEGSRRLTRIITSVRDTQSADWREVRRTSLTYDMAALGYNGGHLTCGGNGAPLRYLMQIDVTARDHSGNTVSLPPVTFQYGPTERSLSREISWGGGYLHEGDEWGASSVPVDVNSDGLLDRVIVRTERADDKDSCRMSGHSYFGRGLYGDSAPDLSDWSDVALDTQEWMTLGTGVSAVLQLKDSPYRGYLEEAASAGRGLHEEFLGKLRRLGFDLASTDVTVTERHGDCSGALDQDKCKREKVEWTIYDGLAGKPAFLAQPHNNVFGDWWISLTRYGEPQPFVCTSVEDPCSSNRAVLPESEMRADLERSETGDLPSIERVVQRLKSTGILTQSDPKDVSVRLTAYWGQNKWAGCDVFDCCDFFDWVISDDQHNETYHAVGEELKHYNDREICEIMIKDQPAPPTGPDPSHHCTANGQYQIDPSEYTYNTFYNYRFVDFNSDGRADLLSSYSVLRPEVQNLESTEMPFLDEHGRYYPWHIYANTDSAISPSSALIRSAWPLPPTISIQSFNPQAALPQVSIERLIDINGDGLLDSVWPYARYQADAPSLIGQQTVWLVSRGIASANLSERLAQPVEWAGPREFTPVAPILPPGAWRYQPPEIHLKTAATVSLKDINRDNLPDLLVQLNGGTRPLVVSYNTGAGFEKVLQGLNYSGAVEATQLDGTTQLYGGQNFAYDAWQARNNRLLDIDGDGLDDMVEFDLDPDDAGRVRSCPKVSYNLGDTFMPAIALPGDSACDDGAATKSSRWFGARAPVRVDGIKWKLQGDYFDVNGDGLGDLISWEDQQVKVQTDDVSQGHLRLLKSVENGRGARVEFTYASSTDPSVVSGNGESGSEHYLPTPVMVVTSMKVTGGSTDPEMVTDFEYGDPVFASPRNDQPARFLGFETAATKSPQAVDGERKLTRHQYEYNSADPNGHLTHEWIYNGSQNLQQYRVITWAQEQLPGDNYRGGPLLFNHPVETITHTCAVGESEQDCTQKLTGDVHWKREAWASAAQCLAGPALPANSLPLYLLCSVSEGMNVAQPVTDRITEYEYEVRYGQAPFRSDDYRYLTKIEKRRAKPPSADALVLDARQEVTFNVVTGLPEKTDKWVDETTTATTWRNFDPATGNVTSLTKPAQAATGRATIYTYDSNRIFVATTTNELWQTVKTEYDPGTGALLSRSGPNVLDTWQGRLWQREQWTLDGLGRVLERRVTVDDPFFGYRVVPVERFTYYDREFPNRVVEERLRDFNSEDWWSKKERTADGLGRVLSEIEYLTAPLHAVTCYHYDAAGQLAAIDVPDPSVQIEPAAIAAEAALPPTCRRFVTYHYQHDALGRVTGFVQPDGNSMSVTYDGLKKTVREQTRDGSGGATIQVQDALGRLIEVHELNTTGDAAITRYRYQVDKLAEVKDAEGNLTQFSYDYAGRRTAITRGSRTWRYRYDLNGNVIAQTSPVPSGESPCSYTKIIRYDDLDRVVERRRMNQTDVVEQLLGPGQPAECEQPTGTDAETVTYGYDKGRNGIGRLAQVSLAFGEVHYAYNIAGQVTSEERSFEVTSPVELSVTQKVIREYNALGRPTLSTWDDGQQWRTTYDIRGLVEVVDWYDPTVSSWRPVARYNRSVTGQPTTRYTSFGQQRNYRYDPLGRPVSDTVAALGEELASRTYQYYDAGDLKAVDGETDGVSAAAEFTYDAQHRLKSASGPNHYTASFTYSPTGNITGATRAGAGSCLDLDGDGRVTTADIDRVSRAWEQSDLAFDFDRDSAVTVADVMMVANELDKTCEASIAAGRLRYEYGAVDPQAVDRLVNVDDGSVYMEFEYDLSGNMIKRGTDTFEWDYNDRLRAAHGPRGDEYYYYDHEGNRMLAVNAEGVRFWFAESETHYDKDGAQTRRYLHLSDGGSTIARVENRTKIELQYADALQNLMLSLDREGEVSATFLYGAFGEVVYSLGEDNHRRQFNGKENDLKTGLRYYGFRYYDPLLLRWNSADPYYRFIPEAGLTEPQRLNLYSFSLNNPVRYYDPDGRETAADPRWILSRTEVNAAVSTYAQDVVARAASTVRYYSDALAGGLSAMGISQALGLGEGMKSAFWKQATLIGSAALGAALSSTPAGALAIGVGISLGVRMAEGVGHAGLNRINASPGYHRVLSAATYAVNLFRFSASITTRNPAVNAMESYHRTLSDTGRGFDLVRQGIETGREIRSGSGDGSQAAEQKRTEEQERSNAEASSETSNEGGQDSGSSGASESGNPPPQKECAGQHCLKQ